MPGYPGATPRESLSDKIHDLAKAFSNTAGTLSNQYTSLNKATNGLLNGTNPWQGKGANAFSDSWQSFGKYMQSLEDSCNSTSRSLNKMANKISDIENQQAWAALLTIVGGVATVVSLAASIAQLGLDPFTDGLTAFFGTFTEQEGADVLGVSEDVTQADSQAATELQTIEDDLANSPEITGPAPTTPGEPDISPVSPQNLDNMTLSAKFDDAANNMTVQEWEQWIDDYTFDYTPPANEGMDGVEDMNGAPAVNGCAPSAVKMLLEDNGMQASDQQIMNAVGYNPASGSSAGNIANGMRQLGFPNATYNPGMTLNQLENETAQGKPVIVGLNLSTNPNVPNAGHAVVVDGFVDNPDLGTMVQIRDPYFVPPKSYMLPLQAFQGYWQFGGITY